MVIWRNFVVYKLYWIFSFVGKVDFIRWLWRTGEGTGILELL